MGWYFVLISNLSQSEDGWLSIQKALQKGSNGNVSDVLYIFEMILCFDVWINQTYFWSTDSNENFVVDGNTPIKLTMKEIKGLLP